MDMSAAEDSASFIKGPYWKAEGRVRSSLVPGKRKHNQSEVEVSNELCSLRFHKPLTSRNKLFQNPSLLKRGRSSKWLFPSHYGTRNVFIIKIYAYPPEPCHFSLPWVAVSFHTHRIRYVLTSGTGGLGSSVLKATKTAKGIKAC